MSRMQNKDILSHFLLPGNMWTIRNINIVSHKHINYITSPIFQEITKQRKALFLKILILIIQYSPDFSVSPSKQLPEALAQDQTQCESSSYIMNAAEL